VEILAQQQFSRKLVKTKTEHPKEYLHKDLLIVATPTFPTHYRQ